MAKWNHEWTEEDQKAYEEEYAKTFLATAENFNKAVVELGESIVETLRPALEYFAKEAPLVSEIYSRIMLEKRLTQGYVPASIAKWIAWHVPAWLFHK